MFPADCVTFTEEILSEKLRFFLSVFLFKYLIIFLLTVIMLFKSRFLFIQHL